MNAAGDALISPSSSPEELRTARAVVNNWRAAHSLPLDRVRVELEQKVAEFGENALVAQRLKRLSSIDAKLRRFRSMNADTRVFVGRLKGAIG